MSPQKCANHHHYVKCKGEIIVNLYDFFQSLLWLQQAPQMAESLVRRIDTTLWTQDKGSDGFFVFHCKSSRKIFMISVREFSVSTFQSCSLKL
jgi:hypothetical protein